MADRVDKFEPCCFDMRKAMDDKFVVQDPNFYLVFIAEGGVRITFGICPWCGKNETTAIYTKPPKL